MWAPHVLGCLWAWGGGVQGLGPAAESSLGHSPRRAPLRPAWAERSLTVRPAVPAGGKRSERPPALASPLRHAERGPGGALPPRHLLQQPAAERATAHRGPGPRGASRGVRGPGAHGAQISAQGAASGGERGLGVAGQGPRGGSAPGCAPSVSSHRPLPSLIVADVCSQWDTDLWLNSACLLYIRTSSLFQNVWL